MSAPIAAPFSRPIRLEGWEFTVSVLVGLGCGVVLLIAVIFLPWWGDNLTLNAARIVSDNLYGAAGALAAPWLWLLPLVTLLAVVLGLWGALKPDYDAVAAAGMALVGLLGLAYFALAAPGANPAQPGLGHRLALLACLGLAGQLALAHPRVITVMGRRRLPWSLPKSAWPVVFLAPPLILYFIWIIAPTVYTIYLSFTDWDSVSAPRFIGLRNYIHLFTRDRNFTESLVNNLRWLVVFITVPTTLGLAMALIFNTEMRGGRWYKVSFYAPLVLSLPVIGLIWAWVYNPRLGLINQFLMQVGVEPLPGWLGDRRLAIWCVIAAAVWRQVGYVMVLYLAGLKNLDPTLLDAAMVDGASRWQLFRFVVLPLLAPVTTIIIVISIIDSLRAFDLVAIMTRGGQSTQVLANFMYMEAFNNYRMGYGAAIAVILFLISLVFIGFYLSRVVKEELEY
ncbi:MAG: sugar ABC transporter permease [Anaerolineae bacterium]|nr:sugar ABC transporter permease [Caldilineales bacterium]MCX7853832.1 sugar ABC transporter permease [Caldilineales bacterium]MDW8268990.1 sugar ABC transporter permease [Anaerolineae bacterium]